MWFVSIQALHLNGCQDGLDKRQCENQVINASSKDKELLYIIKDMQ
jgi:hypothetical protein